MSMRPVSGSSEAAREFVRACGLDPATTGDFTIECKVAAVVTGHFNVFLTEDQLARLRAVVEADPVSFLRHSHFNVTVFDSNPKESK